MRDEVFPLTRSSIHARRHPAAIAGVWAWQSVLAVLATLPAVTLVRSAFGRYPAGDAALWEAGSLPLLDLVSREATGVRAATTTATALLVVAALAGLVPLASMMFAIANAGGYGRPVGAASAVGGGVRAFRSFALLLLTTAFAQGLVGAMAVLSGELAEAWTHARLGEAHALELGVAVGAAFAPGILLLGVMHDLARAAVVRLELSPLQALVVGVELLRDSMGSLAWSWSWRTLASLAPLIAVAFVADGIGGKGGATLLALGLLHQLVVVVRVALRASWLAKALRSVDDAAPRAFEARHDSAGG
jgi:hypothetical protein